MDNLDRVFTRLKEKGLEAKPSKCVLFRNLIDFLGDMISADGIQPQPDKLAAIRDWPTPHCLRGVRAFYGLASYYRKFVKYFAKIAEPLSRMTKKNTPFMWTDETQQSFEELKKALIINQSINQFFNYRNVKTHFHMRKTQSSKMYVKSVNTYHYITF